MRTDLYIFFCLNKTVLVLTCLFLLLSCTAALPPADLERAEQLRSEGRKLNLKHNYSTAAERYKEATLYDPLNTSAYLNLADLLETLEKYADAVDTYDRALRYLPADDSNREIMTYRSALLLAAKLGKQSKAESRLNKLNTPDLKNDLTGVIIMHRGDPAQALSHYQNALKYDLEGNQYARVYFHIAQAYDLLGDADRSSDALLISVEKATSRPLKEDIRRFFEAILSRR